MGYAEKAMKMVADVAPYVEIQGSLLDQGYVHYLLSLCVIAQLPQPDISRAKLHLQSAIECYEKVNALRYLEGCYALKAQVETILNDVEEAEESARMIQKLRMKRKSTFSNEIHD